MWKAGDASGSKVNASSLVDLKAELFRKREQFEREKTNPAERLKAREEAAQRRPTSGIERANRGVHARAKRDEVAQVDTTLAKQLERSRAALEEKSRAYDDMKRRGLDTGEDGSKRFLVDFEKKALQVPFTNDERRERDAWQRQEEEENTKVEYVDAFGRTRMVTQREKEKLERMDADMGEARPDLLSVDMARELERQAWERAAQMEMESEPVAAQPVFFENVANDEIRSMGVGYFSFSTDTTERERQMGLLNTLREQTNDQRRKREALKQRRKDALARRLQRIAERKRVRAAAGGGEGRKLEDLLLREEAEEREGEGGGRGSGGQTGVDEDELNVEGLLRFYREQSRQKRARQAQEDGEEEEEGGDADGAEDSSSEGSSGSDDSGSDGSGASGEDDGPPISAPEDE